MTRKTRRFIFYIFLALFIILAVIIVFYAQGYSFDWQNKSLTITGAFYLKSHSKKADIYLEDEYKGKTSKFVKRLLPGEYNIKISNSDYWDWEKTLTIKSKLVTEAKNILLIKKEPQINKKLNFDVKQIYFSKDYKKAVYLISSQRALRVVDFTDNSDIQIYPTFNGHPTAIYNLPDLSYLQDISWSHDSSKLLLSFLSAQGPDHYYTLDLRDKFAVTDLNKTIVTSYNYKIYNIEDLLFHPQDSNKIYFLANDNLYLINVSGDLSQPIVSNVLAYTIYDNEILYLYPEKNSYILYKTNPDGSYFRKLFEIPFLKLGQDIKIINDELLIIGETLYLFKQQTELFEKVADYVKEVSFLDGKEKLLWRTGNTIGVIWLRADSEQPVRQQFDTEIIVNSAEEINKVIWYAETGYHIIFLTGNKVMITELDGRSKRNTTEITELSTSSGESPEIFYSNWNKKLYILNQEQLFELEL